jgi:hypothetical protein
MAKAKTGTGVTKIEAVKRALAELGKDAKVLDIQAYVKQHFGIEISTGVIYTYKKNLADKLKESKQAKPAPANGISKMDAVRQALSELGKTSKPVEIQKFVKERFNITMTVGHVSNYKTTILAKKKRKAPAKTVRSDVAVTSPVPPAPVAREAGKLSASVSLEDIRTVKSLLASVGADDLKDLIDLVAK